MERFPPSLLPSLPVAAVERAGLTWGHDSRRVGPAPHLLQHSGEQPAPLLAASSVELALDLGVAVESATRACAQESPTCLLSAGQWCRWGRDVLHFSLILHHLWQVGELAPGS